MFTNLLRPCDTKPGPGNVADPLAEMSLRLLDEVVGWDTDPAHANAQHAGLVGSCELQPSELGRMGPSVGPMISCTAVASIAMMVSEGRFAKCSPNYGEDKS